MERKYQRRGNIAAVIWLVTIVVFSFLSSSNETVVIPWENAHVLWMLTLLISGVSWFYAFWAYVKAMGHSGLWAIAGIFWLPGLIVLLLLRDKN